MIKSYDMTNINNISLDIPTDCKIVDIIFNISKS